MSEQTGTSGKDGRAGEPKRRSAVPLIVGLLAILVLGVVAGYVLATTRAAGESDAGETAAPAAEPVATSTTQAQRPVAVALEGVALTPLSGPPEGTMAMLETSTVSADATYEVTFRPYGYGPGQPGSSAVIRIEQATPQNASAERFNMSGRNVLVTLVGAETEIAEGGLYAGILGFRPQGSLLSPMIRDVRRTD